MTKEIHYEKKFNGYDGRYDVEIKHAYQIIPWGIKEAWLKNIGIQQSLAIAGALNPPWLALSREQLLAQAAVFPDGQVILEKEYGAHDANGDAGSMSMLPIIWDGNVESLPSLSYILGPNSDGMQAFAPDGNTLVITSLLVSPSAAKQDSVGPNHVTAHLVQYAKDYAKQHGMKHVIWSLPTGFDWEKAKANSISTDYNSYVLKKHLVHAHFDYYRYVQPIQRVSYIGMYPLTGDYFAIQKAVDLATFNWYKDTYKNKPYPSVWKEVQPGKWIVGGDGLWEVKDQTAIYTEPHAWIGVTFE